MAPGEFQGLPLVPATRACGCGQRVRWSHLEYLGRGRSAPLYVCVGCGLSYRGQEGEGERRASAARSRRPLPEEGPPSNPVLDEATAERLRQLLAGS
ncbi:MAG TPA: hypothetical protein VI138_05800 [Candidatus Dormibacteraeota bacterium]